MVIEYNGDEAQRFYHLIIHLFKTLDISDYSIYQGKYAERLQVFIHSSQLTLEEADAQLEYLSNSLKEKMSKKWKCLPSLHLPEAYNIVTLPHKIL